MAFSQIRGSWYIKGSGSQEAVYGQVCQWKTINAL